MVTVAELDRAITARTVWIGKENVRAVRCVVHGCRTLCLPGMARVLWLDGHYCGFACSHCTFGLRSATHVS
jgi:hypothetical protein